jgi:hypothetical protein
MFPVRYELKFYMIFVCFVWFSQYTAIISLNSINRLGFVAETECVSCEVRTEFLYSAHTVYLCVPYDSHNTQRLFP